MRLLNLTATAVLGVSILSGCGGGSSGNPAADDVKVTTCTADPAGGKPKAAGTIVNNTSKPSGYTLRVSFKDPAGNTVSEGTSAVARVEPSVTAKWELTGGASAAGALTCDVGNVTRNAVGT